MQNVRYIIKNIDENTFSSSFVLIDEVMGSAVIKKTDEKTFEVSNIFIKEEFTYIMAKKSQKYNMASKKIFLGTHGIFFALGGNYI